MRTHRLLAAAFVSLLVHALAMSGAWIPLPAPPSAPPPLMAQLVERPSPPPSVRRDPTPDRPPVRNVRRPAPPRETFTAPLPADAIAMAMPAESADAEPDAPSPEDLAPDAGPPPTPPDATPTATATATEVAPPQALPTRAQLIYTLYLGADNFAVGRSVLVWTLEHGTYSLVSDSETTGVVELFRPQRLTYTSAGKVTEQGLRPEIFAMSRTRRGKTDAAQARLDWEARQLTYGRPAEQRTVDLPPPSQDIMSFLFQLALYPPAPGRLRVPITNGVRFETYELEVLAEEKLETPFGILNTLPLRHRRKEAAEGIEVWLAVDYRYLPVKVRFIDRDGNLSGEQIINEIRISQQ